jgi:UDP-glucose:(heptosyl)LPS alpha-1,3-glucosyltransferase
VRRELRRGGFDLVQSNERIPGCDVYRAGDGVHREWLCQRRRVQSPLARLATALSPFHAYVKRAEKQLFESPQLRAVICNSQMVRREIFDYFAVDPEKLRVVYNGVDTDKFHPALKQYRRAVRNELGIPQHQAVFLFVGSGFERKGLGPALEAVARLPRGRLLVVGKDRHVRRYRRLAERLGILGRVHLLGVKPDVGPYYGAADALVLPTLYDPFPNVVLEGMAAGLPVVTSTKCGGAELIREGQNGYVCDALDRGGLTAAMNYLLDREHAECLGRDARRCVEPYTLAAMRANLTGLYEELLNGRP